MSRNIRIKIPTTPVKVAKRRLSDSSDSSSLNLSDDEGYSAVEDVSESDEDDEEHVFAAEEDHIITNASRKRAPPRPVEESDDADEDGDDEDDDAEEEDDDPADDHESWDGILTDPDDNVVEQPASYILEQDTADVTKHVRFTGVPDSDSESTTTEASEDDMNDFFPDIFVAQNNLDPAFRKEIENDDNSSNSGSFWDFNGGSQDFYEVDSDNEPIVQDSEETTPTITPMASHPPTAVSTPVAVLQDMDDSDDFDEFDELDGYESDGETTEEDIPEPPVRRKQIRRAQTVDLTSDSDTERATPSRPGKPHIGRFKLDTDKKPIAVLNPMTRKMMIFTPQRNNRLDLSPESFNFSLPQPDLTAAPILSNPGYLMMGAMLSQNTFGDFINTQPFGPAEAFFPLTSDAFTGDDSDYSEMAQEDEEESKLEIEDFITFQQDGSDKEDDAPAEDYFGDAASSPTRPTTAASGASAATDDVSAGVLHPLLSHFDNNSNAVGAFRRNQITQQLILSDKISQESLAFSGPYHQGTLRGIKSGSMETVTTPITPARRQKRSNTVAGFADASASPLSQKRKASNYMEATHKRHRSISDMEVLQLS